jgi:hypothetical protein
LALLDTQQIQGLLVLVARLEQQDLVLQDLLDLVLLDLLVLVALLEQQGLVLQDLLDLVVLLGQQYN